MFKPKHTKNILIICNATFVSGAEISLFQFLGKSKYHSSYTLVLPKRASQTINFGYQVYNLPLIWFCKTYNPIKLFPTLYSLFISTYFLCRIIRKNKIEIIYANSIQSYIYAFLAKILTRKKMIWHVRDNFKQQKVLRPLIRKSNITICISKFCLDQLPNNIQNKHLIYGGIDTEYWKPFSHNKSNDKIIICQVGQLTSWKNHIDFVKAVKIIINKGLNAQFLIIGDDLSGREKKYKEKIIQLIHYYKLDTYCKLLGNISDVKQQINQIDILIHPAINEPFGRVIIEAMAMGKPIVAYNCGGPKEIIEDGKTGFLVEPNNYKELAEKTMLLISNKELRRKMGKTGRQRVVEIFNIERYVQEMEVVFDNVMEY